MSDQRDMQLNHQTDSSEWAVVFVCPGQEELPLLAQLSTNRNTRIVAICDPLGTSVGTGLAQIMGLRVINSLEELKPGDARYMIHPPRNQTIAPLVDQAGDFGLEPILADRFLTLMNQSHFQSRPMRGPALLGGENSGFMEEETATIHSTLNRIEEALDGESLLRWLLGLATRATGAGSGSIMLLDQATEELYLGFAYGLSQHTMHRARVKLGEGVAGQVALSRQAQCIHGDLHSGAQRDRPSIQNAVCSPLVWDGVLLGVLSVSSDWGEPELNPNALETIQGLTQRLGMILSRFLRLQDVVNGDIFRELDENFAVAQEHSNKLGEILKSWLEDLKRVCGSEETKLSLLTEDGDLLVADLQTVSYPAATTSGIAEILVTGNPLVQTPAEDLDPEVAGGSTIFHLPVGRNPVTAVLTTKFASASIAHKFHRISGEILYLLNKHLGGVLERAKLRDQVSRLTALSGFLAEIAPFSASESLEVEERILSTARDLTGAQQAFLLYAPLSDSTASPAPTPDEKLLRVAENLLEQAQVRAHKASVMTFVHDPTMDFPRSVLAVPLQREHPYPGLVLLDKKRLHPLDGKVFTEFDSIFASRLAPLFQPVARTETAQAEDLRPAREELGDVSVQIPTPISSPTLNRSIEDILRREMDRCDRYHNMLGLAGFRCDPSAVEANEIPSLVQDLCGLLRSSDIAACLEDGTILVLVPEDIQSLPRLKNRVIEILRRLTGNSNLQISAITRAYPGGGNTAAELLEGVLSRLG
ncbi:MAG: GAF domain-containing protein [Gemmatimonadales bacterium]|nr:GAF domain-containing protein [Gemmatimonadales bacterium]